MANSIVTVYPQNGSRNFTAKIDFFCDTLAELTNVVVIDIASLTGLPTEFKVKNISWQLSDFTVKLLWDATAPIQAIALNQYEGDIDFLEDVGVPIINNAGAGVTGNLLITTIGLKATSAGSIYIRGYH